MKIYSIKDTKGSEFAPPFISRTDLSAIRSFQEMIHGGKIVYADDFELYRIGSFDIDTGIIVPETPILLDTPFDDGKENK